MKQRIFSFLLTICMLSVLVVQSPVKANAATDGYYTYTVSNGKATITDCNASISGNITIPSTLGGYTVTKIDEYAFASCENLTGVTIPDNITSIGACIFSNCTSLKSITVAANNPNYSSLDGHLFNKNRTQLLQYAIGSPLNSYTIPGSVTTIETRAFFKAVNLKSIGFPESVTTIKDEAFHSCQSLTSLAFPKKLASIGRFAFSQCDSLSSVTIPDSVTGIGERAFFDCEVISSVSIGSGVTSIGENAFYACPALKNITVNANNPAYSSLDGHLLDKNQTNFLQYAVGKSATSYTVPHSVTTIGNLAFASAKLTNITLQNGVTAIGDSAFLSCTKLTSITLPDSLTTIGSQAFNYCKSLNTVYYQGTYSQWQQITVGSFNTALKDASLSCQWIPEAPTEVNVCFHANGGSNAPKNQVGGEKIVLSETTPTRVGHSFLGWSSDSNATIPEYQPGGTITLGTEDIYLYAVWSKVSYVTVHKTSASGIPMYQVKTTAIPTNAEIIFACYRGNKLVCFESATKTENEDVYFFLLNQACDCVKVTVWDKLNSLTPVCEPEEL